MKNGICIKYEQKLMGLLAKYRHENDDGAYLQLLARLCQHVENELGDEMFLPTD